MEDVVVRIVTAIFIAVVSAFVTVRLSLNRFYVEKWWERKANAYTTIIEAIHHMRHYCNEQLDAASEDRDLSEKREKELESRRKDAADEIQKAIDVGSFVLNEEAAELLASLGKELYRAKAEPTWWDYLAKQEEALRNVLPKLKEIARRELRAK